MPNEFFIANHNKADHSIYLAVPDVCRILLAEIPSIAGLVFGGSYAKGSYKDGDDVDMDILYEDYPFNFLQEIRLKIIKTFSHNNLTAHIRAPMAKNSIPAGLREYKSHPYSPFALRNKQMAEDWGLSVKE